MSNALQDQLLQILESNKDRIFRICRSHCSATEEAKDLFQDVVFNLWKSLPSFKNESNINTWVYRITLNVCIRSKQRSIKKESTQIRLDSIHYENIAEPTIHPQQEKLQKLNHCISKLEETEKSIILLHLEELPYKEIAQITGLTENHIAVKIKRIKEKLFTCISA
jgi:RNA polymerase sigma factor (sigma-70 family)